MKKIDLFVNRYPLSKTLRFSLIPVGKTEENFNNALLLENDKERAEKYEKVKKYIDRYHKHFIETVLVKFALDEIREYAELYFKTGKGQNELNKMIALEAKMRKQISNAFTKDSRYKEIFGQDIIKTILPSFLTDKDELREVEIFYDFTTYFTGFHTNRKNMYSEEMQSTSISYRCINDNLPKFLDNIIKYNRIKEILSVDELTVLDEQCMKLNGVYLKDIFCVDYFNFVLSQSGIDRYNDIIGGYTDKDGKKIKGLNECVNLHNQQAGKDKSLRLPFITPLYKQILSDRETISFIPESFDSDDEVLSAINEFYNKTLKSALEKAENLFNSIFEYNKNGIYVSSGSAITDISNAVFKNWSAVSDGWNKEYGEIKPLKKSKDPEKYHEERTKEYKSILSFSVADLQKYGDMCESENETGDILTYFSDAVINCINKIKLLYSETRLILTAKYTENNDKKLCVNENAIVQIKSFLDSIKELEYILKHLKGSGKEENKDVLFYSSFYELYDTITDIDKLYDKVRNYVTKKPYSKDKIKLNFENTQLLGGWDKNKERDYRTVLLRKNNKYYLAVMDKSHNKSFIDPPECDSEDCWEKIEYKLLPGPNKMLPKVFFASSNIDIFKPDKKILDIRKKESFKKGANFNIDDCHMFIDFYKASIQKHEDWSQFGFEFSPTYKYKDISEFYNEVKQQGYSIKYKNIPDSYINELVEKGYLYLFQIYNKDFSEYSHGKENLHTMYFKMLFDEKNLKDVVYQLNGGAEMFYREASIKENERIIHPANQSIDNKNPDNPKKESTFTYDIIKNKRFTKRQFSLHLPITMNFKAVGQEFLNYDVRSAIKNSDENYIIGIDRGERNLLYVCVINSNGEIVEQKSLNEIISDNNYKVNYHTLLDEAEKGRDNARKNWGTIENIKELKQGYLSQVIHQICEYVMKYDAIIAMEDLNFGFKRGRFKVEKQVYQNFENMLSTKLNYLVDKSTDSDKAGGLLKAYQLTNKVDGVNRGRQNGIIFYVPAWLTSKIDPVTGFVDLVKPRYTSVGEAVSFIEKIDDIRFNNDENLFEFDIDYSKFANCSASFKKKWTVCTNGERIINIRNKEKNNLWDNKIIVLTEEFKALFDEYGIDITKSIKNSVLRISNADFHKRLLRLFAYTLQMRNSETGNTEVDYLISPVKGSDGVFYDSRVYSGNSVLPENADANGAYNIARKAMWAISVLKQTEDDKLKEANLTITNADWLEYVQK